MKFNGSLGPVFETDSERSYFVAILRVHHQAKIKALAGEQVSEQVGE